MEFEFNGNGRVLGELIVRDENTQISKGIVGYMGDIESGVIENMVDVCVEMVEFSRQPKVEFFYDAIKKHLGDWEIQGLIDILNGNEEE